MVTVASVSLQVPRELRSKDGLLQNRHGMRRAQQRLRRDATRDCVAHAADSRSASRVPARNRPARRVAVHRIRAAARSAVEPCPTVYPHRTTRQTAPSNGEPPSPPNGPSMERRVSRVHECLMVRNCGCTSRARIPSRARAQPQVRSDLASTSEPNSKLAKHGASRRHGSAETGARSAGVSCGALRRAEAE